ncbi:MAG: hypothetical protein R3A10_09505 [Caldilineaceae bacterium]
MANPSPACALSNRTIVRARPCGSLYPVVDLTGDYPERVRLTESLLSVMQRTYYGEKGSQSHVLTESVRAARRKIDEVNHRYPDQPVQAGIICGLSQRPPHGHPQRVPPWLVTTGNRVERYPSNLQTTDAGLPDRPANWEIYRQEVEQGVALFVGTSRWLGTRSPSAPWPGPWRISPLKTAGRPAPARR